ncbi:MAG: zinc-dependent alcohol dehydrogenase [Candidatus Merdivicinus sp.]|jgi:threonine dehydrogenase-like Zn-dependent dehydrogenase
MYAAVVEKPNQLVIKEIPKPIPGPHQFVMKTLAASICNATDNHIVEGIFDGYHDHYPQTLGHEVCGEVVELGPEVRKVKIGERIALYTPNGAFAEYVLVDEIRNGFAKVPENMSNEVASICEMFDGAYRSTIACAELQPGERVLIIGAGPMGLTAAGAAAAKGAVVCVVDFYQNRLDKALEMGAKYVYNHSQLSADEIIEAVRKDVGEIDLACICIALDRSKDLDAFYMPVELVRPNGRMTSLNVEVKLEYHNHQMNPFHMNRKNIKYRHNLEREGTIEDFQEGYDLVAAGKIPMEKLITHHVTLDELPWALDLCHNHLDSCIKVIVYPTRKE